MLTKLKSLIFGHNHLGGELPRLASVTTPDRIIVAAIIQSFGKEFEHWEVISPISPELDLPKIKGKGLRDHKSNEKESFVLRRSNRIKGKFAKPLEIKGRYLRKTFRDGDYCYHTYAIEWRELTVNAVAIDPEHIPEILSAYAKMRDAVRIAEETAATAARNMQLNEEKWNLVEEFTGLVRDANGRVIFPQYDNTDEKEEEDCDDFSECDDFCEGFTCEEECCDWMSQGHPPGPPTATA